MKIKPITKIHIFALIFLFSSGLVFSQNNISGEYSRRFQSGSRNYSEARWHQAAADFRYAQEIAVSTTDIAQALYWVILAELALADYGSALRDMDELDRIAPHSNFARDMVYHRARIYYNQGYFEDALIFFKRYNDSVTAADAETEDRKAAAFFWMGECLYSMGQFDEAEKFYAWVIARYPKSPKVEISSYRIDLIKQKKIEAELLALLRWSHEESLRTSEDYQRRIRTYEFTLNAYQRRISELTHGVMPESEILAPSVNGNGKNGNGNGNGMAVTEPVLEYLPPEEPSEISAFNNDYSNDYSNYSESDLIRRARELEREIQRILNQYEGSGGSPR
jgi:tetratricopeptide (TPR) repeat protein